MITVIECIPCLARQAAEAVALAAQDPERRERALRTLLKDLAGADWQVTPPVIAQRLHRTIREGLDNEDPYREVKARMNRIAVQCLPAMREAIERHPDSSEAVVRLAIGGNLLDAGAKTRIMAEELPAHLDTTWATPLHGDVANLFRAAKDAHSILYLADNAGEIIFDRLLIEALPAEKITVAVRGAPVINDATMEDAVTAHLPEIVPVIDNGLDAPGTVLEHCSEAFRNCFDRADLVIAKGQGNYETLSDTTKHTFFLFTVKCPIIADHAGEPIGSLVIKEVGASASGKPSGDD
ncbi:MAG: damage-control phosphatase ARMT1 family protein [Opitutales bacterium]